MSSALRVELIYLNFQPLEVERVKSLVVFIFFVFPFPPGYDIQQPFSSTLFSFTNDKAAFAI